MKNENNEIKYPNIMKLRLITAIICSAILFSCSENKTHKSALLKYDSEIDAIIRQMTLEEKINMLHGKHMFTSSGIERLSIADMHYVDGPFGIREEMEPNSWKPLGWETDKATFFPTGSALAATWSPGLAYKYGTGMAREARLRGKDMLLGPAINIQRLPTGGRTYEYLSEDPFLSAILSTEYTKGVQDNGVAVCLKHFALNNQENNRGNVNVIIGERAMREIYLPPFQMAVEQGDAFGVMAAYNKVDGSWCSENDMLLDKILRDEWGFAGMVISDWGGVHSTVKSVKSGLNVEMPGNRFLGQPLLDSVKAGIVQEDIIDLRVREILRVRMAIEPVPEELANKEVTSKPEQQNIAYEVASKSIVLLKNDGILPLDLSKKPLIAVIGANATRTMGLGGVGAGVKTLYEVTPLEGLKNRIGDKAEIIYARGYQAQASGSGAMFRRRYPEEIRKEEKERQATIKKLGDEALEAAKKADIVLFIGGNNRAVETEGSDRRDMKLAFSQEELAARIAEVNPAIVTILVTGAPNDLNIINPLSGALLISWFNGTEGGNALADVLLGNISPSGRLPFTLPVRLEDSPAYSLGNYSPGPGRRDIFSGLVAGAPAGGNEEKPETAKGDEKDPNEAHYSEESLVGYRWFDTKNIPVMYPFGHGLTYTSFEYSSLSTDKEKYGKRDVISVSFELKNTGSRPAEEVVQAYVNRINPTVDWPLKELKAFSRVLLKPEESRTVTLTIPVRNLRYWNETIHDWDDDPCDIEILVGASAGDIKLQKMVSLK